MHDHYKDLMNYSRASIGYLSLVYFAMASFSNPFTLSKLNSKLLSDCS